MCARAGVLTKKKNNLASGCVRVLPEKSPETRRRNWYRTDTQNPNQISTKIWSTDLIYKFTNPNQFCIWERERERERKSTLICERESAREWRRDCWGLKEETSATGGRDSERERESGESERDRWGRRREDQTSSVGGRQRLRERESRRGTEGQMGERDRVRR